MDKNFLENHDLRRWVSGSSTMSSIEEAAMPSSIPWEPPMTMNSEATLAQGLLARRKRSENKLIDSNITEKQPKAQSLLSTPPFVSDAAYILMRIPKSSANHALKYDDCDVSLKDDDRKVKKARLNPFNPSALHEACRQGPSLSLETVERILNCDSEAASRSVSLNTTKKVYNRKTNRLEEKIVPEKYTYSLNLAISYKVRPEILERIVKAWPNVLNTTDSGSRSIHILLRHNPHDVQSIDMILLCKPSVAAWTDKSHHTALHMAVSYGATLRTVQNLCIAYPKALSMRNSMGQTPTHLSHRLSSICPDDVADFLEAKSQCY